MTNQEIFDLKMRTMRPLINHFEFVDNLKREVIEYKMRGGVYKKIVPDLERQIEKMEYEMAVEQLKYDPLQPIPKHLFHGR